MQKDVTYPDHVLSGITRNHRAYPLPKNLRLFGADTETVRGRPHTVQMWDGLRHKPLRPGQRDPEPDPWLSYVDRDTILPTFWELVRPGMREGGVNICYFHNLRFDLMVLFAAHHETMYEQVNAIKFHLSADARPLPKAWWKEPDKTVLLVEILFGKVNAVEITEGKYFLEKDESLRFSGDVKLKILDSRAFTLASLARSLKMFQIPQSKLEAPKGLGELPLRTPEFENYAKQDVIAQWHLGRKIMDIHEKYAVRPSVSLPQFVSRVFRHDFFKEKWKMDFPPLAVVKASELAYHGGKNGYYLDGPAVMDDLYEIDINSAFPWAMRELPSFVGGRYRRVDTRPRPGGRCGVYCLSGVVSEKTRYPIIFDHTFRPVRGPFEDIWTTSYETVKALESPDIKITKCWGYVWEPTDADGPNPFRDYVDHFYKLKEETPKDDPYYNFYKIALNSLYGKLVGVIEEHEMEKFGVTEEEAEGREASFRERGVLVDYKWDEALKCFVQVKKKHVAGQMYHPFIAALITGRVRALIYDLETRYKAVHTATDSIKTLMKVEDVKGLGGWKVECHGKCYLFRNKLYLHFDKTGKRAPEGSWARDLSEDGQWLVKSAFHGFKGPFKELFDNRRKLIKDEKITYKYKHVVGLREGLRRGETPADFVTRTETMMLRKGASHESQSVGAGGH